MNIDPDSEENQAMTHDNERAVFAAKMQYEQRKEGDEICAAPVLTTEAHPIQPENVPSTTKQFSNAAPEAVPPSPAAAATPTPRTDARESFPDRPDGKAIGFVRADFARQLERELAEARARINVITAVLRQQDNSYFFDMIKEWMDGAGAKEIGLVYFTEHERVIAERDALKAEVETIKREWPQRYEEQSEAKQEELDKAWSDLASVQREAEAKDKQLAELAEQLNDRTLSLSQMDMEYKKLAEQLNEAREEVDAVRVMASQECTAKQLAWDKIEELFARNARLREALERIRIGGFNERLVAEIALSAPPIGPRMVRRETVEYLIEVVNESIRAGRITVDSDLATALAAAQSELEDGK